MLKQGIKLTEAQERTRTWALRTEQTIGCGAIGARVGVGKTLMALSLTMHDAFSRPKERDLYVVPPTLQDQWIVEAERLTTLKAVLCPRYIDDLLFAQLYARSDIHMIVLSYKTLLRAPPTSIIFKIKWKRIIADEAHCMSNAQSQTTQKALLLEAHFRWAVSGTLMTNQPKDLYGISLFLRYISSYPAFQKALATGRLMREMVTQSTKEDIAKLELKNLISKDIIVEMLPKEKLLYDHMRRSIKRTMITRKSDGMKRLQAGVFELLNRLRTAASNIHLTTDPRNWASPSVEGGPEVHLAMMQKKGSKTLRVLEVISDIRERYPNAKILLFSNFLSIIDNYQEEISRRFPNDGPPIVYNGKVPRQKRHQLVEFFKTSTAKECRVMILGFKCGNAGINLQCATHVILNEPFWNQSLEQQAIARAYRKGQTEDVYAYRMLTKDTIDQRILRIAARKQQQIDTVLAGKPASATQAADKLSTAEMDYLLEP